MWNERRFYDGKQQLVVFGETRTPSPLTPLPRLFNKDARSGDTMCRHAAAACRNVSAVHSELFADSWAEWRSFSSDLMTLLYLRPPYTCILIKVVVTPIRFQLASSLRDITQRYLRQKGTIILSWYISCQSYDEKSWEVRSANCFAPFPNC